MTAPTQANADLASFFAPHGRRPLIIAHRGGSLEAPENTLAALRHGVACGAAWQEIDVGLSADDACIVLHDDCVSRTTDGTGNLTMWPAQKLLALHAGRPKWDDDARATLRRLGVTELPDFGDRYAGERIPTLEQALAVPGVRLMIELKPTIRPELLAKKVSRAVAQAGMQARVIVGSFDPSLVAMVAQIAPNLPRIGILEDPLVLPYMLAVGVNAVAVDARLTATLRRSVPAHIAVWAWTVYTLDSARAVATAGADGLITDIPQKLVEAHRAKALCG